VPRSMQRASLWASSHSMSAVDPAVTIWDSYRGLPERVAGVEVPSYNGILPPGGCSIVVVVCEG
jgi:hypothetical protein